jgi:hypothetical protein
MPHIRPFALAAGAAGLLLTGVAPAVPAVASAAASGKIAASTINIQTVSDTEYQYVKYCNGTTCNLQRSTQLALEFQETTYPPKPVTITWQIQDVTTQAGADYTGPTSGTATIPDSNNCANCAFVLVPVVNEGVPDATETFNLVITGTSVRATTTNGTGTINSGAQIPDDCSLGYVSAQAKSLTCTSRPAGQNWYLYIRCLTSPKYGFASGNTVTGDGTSTATCPDAQAAADTGYFET